MFDVGGGLLPQEDDHGGRVFVEWWHSNQNSNFGSAPQRLLPALNLDKQIMTDWYSAGFQYMFSREWGVMARLPYANRDFTTQDPNTLMLNTFKATDWGDLEIMGMYTGFSKDLSTGVMFGLKLPTGNYTAQGFDRDTTIGTGSTDLILGAFHRGLITGDNAWQYFSASAGAAAVRLSFRGQPRHRYPLKPTSLAIRSMVPPASFTTTYTTCSASTRLRRWFNSLVRTASATAGRLPIP